MTKPTIGNQGASFEHGIRKNDDGDKWICDIAEVKITDPNYRLEPKKWSILDELKLKDREFDTEEECKQAFDRATEVWLDDRFVIA